LNRSRLKDYLLFNRNILIGFAGAFLTSAGTSQVIAKITSPIINSLISIAVETSIFLAIFGILFYLENKNKFVDEQGKRKESAKSEVGYLKTSIHTFNRRNRIQYCKTCYSLLAPESGLPTLHCFGHCKFYQYNRIPCCCGLYGIFHSFI